MDAMNKKSMSFGGSKEQSYFVKYSQTLWFAFLLLSLAK